MAKVRPIRVYPSEQDDVFLATYVQSKKKTKASSNKKKDVLIAEEIVREAKRGKK